MVRGVVLADLGGSYKIKGSCGDGLAMEKILGWWR